jgi:hypothetical protein
MYPLGNSVNANFYLVEEEYGKLIGTPYEVLFLFDVVSHFNVKPDEDFVRGLIEKRANYKILTDAERWNFWSSWALSENPGRGILFLKNSGWLEVFPALYATLGTQQNPETHPEGTVFNHMVLSVNVASEIVHREDMDEESAFVLVFSALCHDLGKYIANDNHEKLGVSISKSFLKTIGAPDNIINKVLKLVEFHGADYKFLGNYVNISDINVDFVDRLSQAIHPATIPQLIFVNEADINGRLDTRGELVNHPYDKRISEVFRKILSIYTKSEQDKFSNINVINIFNKEFVSPDDLKPGYPQKAFVNSMNSLIKDGYILKQEAEKVSGYYFSLDYRDALRYCQTLDYRSKKMITDYMNEKNVDLDNLLLDGKSAIKKILNHSEL